MAGGPSNATERLVGGLASSGVRVTVVAPGAPDEPQRRYALQGADVVKVPHDNRHGLLRGLAPWRDAAISVVEDVGPDIVHGQTILTGGAIASAVPRPIRRVVTARGNIRRDTLDADGGVVSRARLVLAERLARRVMRSVDCVVNVHPDWRTNLPIEPHASVHIPNIVDESFFEVQRDATEPIVLYCGGARRIKGADVLFAAWPVVVRSVPAAVLRCVGWPDGQSLPPLANVERRGAVQSDELAREMGRAQLVVLPSRYEVSPIVLAEAWAARTPAVVTDAGGMASLAPGAAVVVPSESPEALADVLTGVLEGSVATDGNVATGRERAERYRAKEVVAAHLAVYEELLARD